MPHQHIMNARTFQCEVCFRSAHQIALRDDLADWIVNIDPMEPPFLHVLGVQFGEPRKVSMVSTIAQVEPDFYGDDYDDDDEEEMPF